MLNDLKYAFRLLIKEPGFSFIIILTLALAIGASTGVFSAVNSILLHPYDDPATDRNVSLRSVKMDDGTQGAISQADYVDIEEQTTSYEFMATWVAVNPTLVGGEETVRVRGDCVTPRFFDLFGVTVAIGRTFSPEEYENGYASGRVVMLGYAAWQRYFGGRPDIVGQAITVNEMPRTVVGVLSSAWEKTGNFNDLWFPWNVRTESPGNRAGADPRAGRTGGRTVGRLKPGVTLQQAAAEASVIANRLAEKYVATNKGFGLQVVPWAEDSMSGVRPAVRLVFAGSITLVLIACANVGSLLLIRASARQRELSVRAALGGNRLRLMRQLVTESLPLALLAGITGTLLAQWGVDYVRWLAPKGAANIVAAGAGIQRLNQLTLDAQTLEFALALSLGAVLLFGLAPAWFASSADLNEALKHGTRGNTEAGANGRLRRTLVIGEIALVIALLACGGMFVRSFLRLANFNPGFVATHGAYGRMAFGGNYSSPAKRQILIDALLARLRESPAVESAAAATFFPLLGSYGQRALVTLEKQSNTADAERPVAYYFFVSPDYFRAAGISLQQGRTFTDADTTDSQPVAIINQTLARRYFPDGNAIGQRIKLTNGANAWRQIVGIVADVGQNVLGDPAVNQTYEPVAQRQMSPNMCIIVRARQDSLHVLPLIKANLRALDPTCAVADLTTLEDYMANKLTTQRIVVSLLLGFSVIALVVAGVGLYGVMAFAVNQRTTEIGIRMALGAQIRDVLSLVMSQGAKLVGIGIALGLVGAFAAGRAIQSMLYHTSGSDPVALLAITLVFSTIAALACWIPARRATKVDPIVALRAD